MRPHNLTTLPPITAQDLIPPVPQESERAHLFTPAAGVLLPLGQAAATGAMAGLAAWIFAALLRSPAAWRWGVGVFAGVLLLAWLLLLWRWLGLTAPLERLTGLDLDQDGYIGPPPTIRVEVQNGRHTTIAELPYADRLADFARGVLAGSPISERTWSGAGALFSQSEFRQVRDIFLARGWFRWSNPDAPQQGIELSPAGRAALRALAEHDTPTPPEGA